MSTTEITMESLAQEAHGWFEIARRATGDTATGPREDGDPYTRVRDGAPEWVTELAHDAHGDMFPDDWKYDCIRSALASISDGFDEDDGPHEFADSEVDVYTSARLAWLASNLSRSGYIEEAVSEGLTESQDPAELAGIGQYMEAREVFELVARSLADRLEAVEDEAGDE